jgi:hypothetical protein
MKALMAITGSGSLMVLSSHGKPDDEAFIEKLGAKGTEKFIAYALSLGEVKERYGGHFQTVVNNLHESDGLRVLGVNGHRVFRLFNLHELSEPLVQESS